MIANPFVEFQKKRLQGKKRTKGKTKGKKNSRTGSKKRIWKIEFGKDFRGTLYTPAYLIIVWLGPQGEL